MATAPKGKDLDAFRASHDKSFIVPKRIREGLAALGESWEYEHEFIKRCGLSQTDFGAYRDQFADFWLHVGGKSPKKVWAGTKAFAAKLREKVS
jgi:hypothetical protein